MKIKTSTRISLIFSIFTFFVLIFFILLINLFFYKNWYYSQLKIQELNIEYIIKIQDFFNNQLWAMQIEFLLLVIFTIVSFILWKSLFSKLILKDIYYISDKLKNTDINLIEKLNINNNKDDEINIIINSINNFLNIISENTQNLKQFNVQIAHEFKTPLMVISSELEFLNLTGKGKNNYDKIESQVDKLNNLLENFLLLTKIENPEIINKEEINLSKIISENLVNLWKIYFEKNIKIENSISKNIKIYSNKYFIEIIIKNILDNAFKYNVIWWKITITFENNILSIIDTWIWIKKENLDKVWDNFYREEFKEKWYWVWLNLVKKIASILWYKVTLNSIKWKSTKFELYF